MGDYNWEMTGAPDPSTAWTDPEAAASWNAYVAQKNELSGGAGQPLQTLTQEGTFVAPPPPTEPPSWLRPEDYVSNGFAAPYTPQEVAGKVDPSWYRPGAGGVTYASVRGPSDLSGGEFVINPNTGTFAKDANGNLIPVPRPNTSGSSWFDDWGVLAVPLLAAGGVAALEGLGAFGGAGELMGPTYGELGYTGLEAGQMGPTYAELGYTGLNNAEAIAAADAAAAAAAGSQVPSWLSSLAGPLTKLGTSSLAGALRQSGGGTSGINPALLPALGKLAQGQSGYGMEIPGIVRTNQNPFFNTPQAPIQGPQKTEMSSLSDLLRQGKPSWQT